MARKKLHTQFITCLIGDPVEHSVSDVMFQHFAKLTGIGNYSHLKLRVSKGNPENLEIAMRTIPVFGIKGANITLPYKESVIPYLDALDRTAKRVGAVNTIVVRNGRLTGYNTDGNGALQAIEAKLRPIKASDNILILGAGGTARAIIGSLPRVARIMVLNRSRDQEQTLRLKDDFSKVNIKIRIDDLTDKNIITAVKEADFIIQATLVGMYPKTSSSLLDKKRLQKVAESVSLQEKFFFDAVFNPFKTQFLQVAKKFGGKTCPGIYMMIYQGIQAFKLWSGEGVPTGNIESLRKLLQAKIEHSYER